MTSVLSHIFSTSICFVAIVVASFFVPYLALAQQSGSLPIATTVVVLGASPEAGEVIVYDESRNLYSLSRTVNNATVYGVSAVLPAVVFATASGTTPVVSNGITMVKVDTKNGKIVRGDLLVSSGVVGLAMKAQSTDEHVFAVAIEDSYGSFQTQGYVMADVSKERAQAVRAAQRVQEEEKMTHDTVVAPKPEEKAVFPFVRAGIATLIALFGLSFILLTFKSVIAKGIVSVGRNPRARGSIIALSFGNIFFALILCGVALFVALAVLVLPI